MRIERLVKKFIGDIYFKDTHSLKQDFIHICEEVNKECLQDEKNQEKLQKIMTELFEVYNTNDFVIMADYLKYKLLKNY